LTSTALQRNKGYPLPDRKDILSVRNARVYSTFNAGDTLKLSLTKRNLNGISTRNYKHRMTFQVLRGLDSSAVSPSTSTGRIYPSKSLSISKRQPPLFYIPLQGLRVLPSVCGSETYDAPRLLRLSSERDERTDDRPSSLIRSEAGEGALHG